MCLVLYSKEWEGWLGYDSRQKNEWYLYNLIDVRWFGVSVP